MADTYSVWQSGSIWESRCHLCQSGGIGYATGATAQRDMVAHYVRFHEADVLAGVWTADDLALMRGRHAVVGEG